MCCLPTCQGLCSDLRALAGTVAICQMASRVLNISIEELPSVFGTLLFKSLIAYRISSKE